MELFDSTKPLITYVSALIIFSFSLLRFLYGDASVFSIFEPLITILGAFIALILVLNLRGAMDFWLSLAIALITIVILAWMFKKLAGNRRWLVLIVMVFFVFVSTLLFWNDYQNNIYGETINVMLHTRKLDESRIDVRPSARWERGIVREFKEKFGAIVEIVPAELIVNERLKQIQEQLEPKSDSPFENSIDYVDVFAIDVIWPGVLAEHAEDLKPNFENLDEFIPAIVQNNTVNTKLVAVPWYVDAGLLFYHNSLLKKYGYDKPPKTWDELEEMAKKIQQGEREDGKKNFWGFVWQGKAYEGLTCNALEWQFSHGGGTIIDESNDLYIEDSAVKAFEQAKNWIWKDKISPPEVLKYDEIETFQTWIQGNAAFMRAWPNAYLASQEAFPPNDVQATLLPKGNGASARHASTLGGWQLMVNAHSKNKKKKAAIKFVKFLTSEEKQLSLADELGKLPTLIELYSVVDESLGFIEKARIKELFIDNSLGSPVVRRPSTSTGRQYPKISEAYFNRVHEILKGNANVREVVEALRNDVKILIPAKP